MNSSTMECFAADYTRNSLDHKEIPWETQLADLYLVILLTVKDQVNLYQRTNCCYFLTANRSSGRSAESDYSRYRFFILIIFQPNYSGQLEE